MALAGPSGVHLGDTTAVAASVDDPAIATARCGTPQSPAAAPVDDPGDRQRDRQLRGGPAAAHIGDTTAGTQAGLNTETGPSGAHLGDVTGGGQPVAYATDGGTSLGDVGSGAAASAQARRS